MIELATENDREEILKLYKMQVGKEFCPWTDEYPDDDTITFDLSRGALFVERLEGRIVAAISIDQDPEVEELSYWNPELAPGGELARLAVLPEMQNRGIARQMLEFCMEELKRRGYKSVHFLVNRHNVKALRSYEHLGFDVVGECYMFEQDFYCYEKVL